MSLYREGFGLLMGEISCEMVGSNWFL